ncbi:MAG TPA: ABC transporter permease [Bryobacteraceae bacterium]|nr:ABC transporter permease [Bryobacteraceae bacterium]
MSIFFNDLRFAWRTLRGKPLFAVVAVFSLALGIGANTAIFSVIESALLHGLPFRDSSQLLLIRDHQSCCEMASVSPGEYLDYRFQTKTLSDLSAFTIQSVTWTGGPSAVQLRAAAVTTNFFAVLGAHSELGRLITPTLDAPGADRRTAVVSDGFWRSDLGADPNVLGRTIILNGNAFRIIGVLRALDSYPQNVQVWVSPRLLVPEYVEGVLAKNYDVTQQYGNHWLSLLGRMKPDASFGQVRAELHTIAVNIGRAHPSSRDHYAVLFPLQSFLVRQVRPALYIWMGAVLLLLLIACSNLAGLMLARSTARTRELAVRISLGATRGRIIRLLLTESLLFAVCGGALGVALARAGLQLIKHYSPYDLPAALSPHLNLPVLVFCLGITCLAALLSGLIPAWRSSGVDTNAQLKDGAKSSVSRGTRRLRHVLVSCEIALSVTLLIGAGLLIESFSNLLAVDPGLDPRHVTTATITLPETRYTHEKINQFWRSLLSNLNGRPEIDSVGLITNIPFSGNTSGGDLQFEGHPMRAHDQGYHAEQFGISPGTFPALRVPILEGRNVSDRDDEKAPQVALINKYFAQTLFPHESPIGKRFKGGPGDSGWTTIVGVVADMKTNSLDDKPEFDIFLNYPQYGMSVTGVVLRSSAAGGNAGVLLRSVLRGLDPQVPLSSIKPLTEYIEGSMGTRRFVLGLLAAFSGIALALAAIGLYAVLAFSVEQRRPEIGIRVALGAASGKVLWIVVQECLVVAASGAALGILGALWSTEFLQSMLYGVRPGDTSAYAFGAGLMIVTATLAAIVPGIRALRIDPVSALRYE